MRILKVLLPAIIGVAFLLAGIGARGSVPIYLARQLPEGTQIKVDGDLSDWGWLAPIFSTSEEVPFARWDVSRDDFDMEAWVAWSPETNMLYHAIKVTDDKLLTLPIEQPHKVWRYDVLEIFVDADHSGGSYRRQGEDSRGAQQYYLYLQPEGSAHLGLFGPEGELGWSLKPPYALYAARYDGKAIYYEVAMRLWDWLGTSPQESRLHQLKAGEVIGWKITAKDRDDESEAPIGCTLRPLDAWENADNFAELMLVP